MCKRMKLDHYLTLYTKTNSKWIKDLEVRPKTIKLLCSKLLDTDLGDDFFNLTPKANAIMKINKWDNIKLKHFYPSKETINRMNTQPSKSEKICANISDKRIIAKIYKELIQLNSKKKPNRTNKNIPVKIWAELWIDFFKRSQTDDQEVHEKMLKVIIRKMKLKKS